MLYYETSYRSASIVPISKAGFKMIENLFLSLVAQASPDRDTLRRPLSIWLYLLYFFSDHLPSQNVGPGITYVPTRKL